MNIASTSVTAVIPTRSRPLLVQRAVRSALNQIHKDLTVLVIVDGPDPETVTALSFIEDTRLQVIQLESSVGAAEARNIGVQRATSRWIAFLDDDDEWLPNKIEAQLSAVLQQDHDKVVAVSRYVYRREGIDDVWPHELPDSGEPLSEHLFRSCSGFQTSTYFCSRQLLLAVPFQRGLAKHQDWDWLLRVSSTPGVRLVVVPDALSIYWVPQHRASVANSGTWNASVLWAQQNRVLLTPRAYSQFIIGICARKAASEGAGVGSFVRLLRESITGGSITPRLVLHLAILYSIPSGVRETLRELLVRGARTQWARYFTQYSGRRNGVAL